MAEGQKETGTEGQGKCWQWRGKKVGDGARKRGEVDYSLILP